MNEKFNTAVRFINKIRKDDVTSEDFTFINPDADIQSLIKAERFELILYKDSHAIYGINLKMDHMNPLNVNCTIVRNKELSDFGYFNGLVLSVDDIPIVYNSFRPETLTDRKKIIIKYQPDISNYNNEKILDLYHDMIKRYFILKENN